MRQIFCLSFLIIYSVATAQKKPLDHSVYDGWQSIGERMISHDGRWIVYSVNPQEGDNELVIQSSDARYRKTIPRGYNARISEDGRYLVFRIRPLYQETREARIRKKKPDDMPKDTLAIVALGSDSVWKAARVKNYKVPEKEAGWVAYHMEKKLEKKEMAKKGPSPEKLLADSLARVVDSLQKLVAAPPAKKKRKRDDDGAELPVDQWGAEAVEVADAEGDEEPGARTDAGTDLVVREIGGGREKVFPRVLDYSFSKKGGKLVISQARDPRDSLGKARVLLYDLANDRTTVLSTGGNEFRGFSFSEDGRQLAFMAERDARPRELQKFFKIWYYKEGMDSATLLVSKTTPGMRLGMTVSEHGNLRFSESGSRLLFGTAPVQPPRDTSLVELDLVKLDIWHYKDDYLQPTQLSRLQRDLQVNYLAVYHLDRGLLKQLGSPEIPQVIQTHEGDGKIFVGVTDFGHRVEAQWTGNTKKDIYAIDVETGERKLVKKALEGQIAPPYVSPGGRYITWYDSRARHYFAWDGASVRNITGKLKVKLWNEEHDSPSDPQPYGVMGWHEGDSLVYIYDRYDVWAVDPAGKRAPRNLVSVNGRKERITNRYMRTNPEERFISDGQSMLFRQFNNTTKTAGHALLRLDHAGRLSNPVFENQKYSFGPVLRARDTAVFVYTKENYKEAPDLYASRQLKDERRLSSINPQQAGYNWGTAELYKWKAFDGKMAEGILYKPEDFDPKKKYPVLFYFYERVSNNLYDYIDPAPTGSRINISFFVSRGYVVLAPDIHYSIGHPARSAYNYVVSAAQSLARNSWVDAKNMGIQGQSWGGIQVAQLITMTNMFKAAWAGAPVANMTSAYGGIRWESGLNRQFQYEKTQSRIGATLWEEPQLYIENSPLFHVPKIKTPLVIMHNDADGAVPWYQGIELFTAMRRLGKPVWMLNYNGEAHNLVQRKNKKDIQVREQQYFDWLLKGEPAPKWIVDGVPAVKKGKDWGLELVY